MSQARQDLHARVASLIDRLADGSRDDAARDQLLCEALRYQEQSVPPYGRLVVARRSRPLTSAAASGKVQGPGSLQARQAVDRKQTPDAWPALPTDVFRFARVASHRAERDVRVFQTSGTTVGVRGRHHLRDLALYDRAARAAAAYAVFPDTAAMRLVVLAPPAEEAPDSSLSYMLSRFAYWFGEGPAVYGWRQGRLDVFKLAEALDAAVAERRPVALLGTSFAFVHAADALGSTRWSLPEGSRVMHTGGFKGLSRELDSGDMRNALAKRYGVGEPWIIQEYGMTELCSQMYEMTLRDAWQGRAPRPRHFWVPGWVRCTPVDPESLEPVPDESTGLLRIDDLANLDTVCAVQTSDLGRRALDGVVLWGRAEGAPARGCSIAVEEALSR